MDPAIKKVAILLAAALIVVIGLIAITHSTQAKKAEVATVKNEAQVIAKTEETKAPTAHEPEEEAKASQEDVTQEAHNQESSQESDQEDAQEIEMYEGALAGLSEEEIAKLAMAEEQSKARTETGESIEESID